MSKPNQPQTIPVLFETNIIVTSKREQPALEIRTLTTDASIMRQLIMAAYHQQPIIIMPRFTSKLRSMAALCELKVLKYDFETDKYYFLI